MPAAVRSMVDDVDAAGDALRATPARRSATRSWRASAGGILLEDPAGNCVELFAPGAAARSA